MIEPYVDPDMIYCPHCGCPIGRKENFMHLYMPNDLRCPCCGKVAIHTCNPRF